MLESSGVSCRSRDACQSASNCYSKFLFLMEAQNFWRFSHSLHWTSLQCHRHQCCFSQHAAVWCRDMLYNAQWEGVRAVELKTSLGISALIERLRGKKALISWWPGWLQLFIAISGPHPQSTLQHNVLCCELPPAPYIQDVLPLTTDVSSCH